jgi:hypothetical protein
VCSRRIRANIVAVKPLFVARWAALAGAAFVACAPAAKDPSTLPAAAPPVVRAKDCPESVEDAGAAVDRAAAAAVDKGATPASRAEAVRLLGCLVVMSKPMLTGNSRVTAGVFTLGLSELVRPALIERAVPSAKRPTVAEALGAAYCDVSDEVHGAAAREVEKLTEPPLAAEVAAPALQRTLACDAEPRRIAAIDVVELRALAAIDAQQKQEPPRTPDSPRDWSALKLWTPLLEAAVARGGAVKRAEAALAKVDAALDAWALSRAQATDVRMVYVLRSELDVPRVGAALRRATPAFRERLRDRDLDVRMLASRSVWLLEGATTESLDTLAAGLWTDLVAAPPSPDDRTRDWLQSKVDAFARTKATREEWDLVEAFEAVARLGPSAEPALPVLRAGMSSKVGRVRQAAAIALALVGRDRKALPPLREETYIKVTHKMRLSALLWLEPKNASARELLGYDPALPLLTAATRKFIQDASGQWFVRALVVRDKASAVK